MRRATAGGQWRILAGQAQGEVGRPRNVPLPRIGPSTRRAAAVTARVASRTMSDSRASGARV